MRCLASIEEQDYRSREIIVVDDGSSDGTEEAVGQRFPDVVRVRLEEHAGIGRALDEGARKTTGDLLVNIDDDAYFVSPHAGEMIAERFRQTPDLAALCFKVEAPDGTVRRREIPRLDKRVPTSEVEVGYFLGGAVAYRVTALRAVGGYATDIGYASEDLDTSFRLFKAGYRMVFTPDIRVVHQAVPSFENTQEREANYLRSRVRIAARYLPAPYAQTHAFLWISRSLLQAALKGHLKRALSAAAESLHSWPRIRSDRTWRLTRAEAHDLSRLSGRTWY